MHYDRDEGIEFIGFVNSKGEPEGMGLLKIGILYYCGEFKSGKKQGIFRIMDKCFGSIMAFAYFNKNELQTARFLCDDEEHEKIRQLVRKLLGFK
jgi:hypothetical protein